MAQHSGKQDSFIVNLTTLFNLANVLKVVGMIIVSCAVVWLNSTYVSVEKFTKLEERVTYIENRDALADKQLAIYVNQSDNLTSELKKINDRLSGIVTPNGTIIYNDKFIAMGQDLESVKRDVSWIKETLYSRGAVQDKK